MRSRIPEPAQPAAQPAGPASEPRAATGLASAVGNQRLARTVDTPAAGSPFRPALPLGVGTSGVATLARQPKAANAAKLATIETNLAKVTQQTEGRGERILAAQDGCIQHLKQANDHLKKSSANYKEGYATFKKVLSEADARHEIDKAIEDSVQGILVAAALAALGPEVALVGVGRGAALGLAGSANGVIQRIGYGAVVALPKVMKGAEGAIGEGMEQVAGAGVDTAKGDSQKPSDTAEGAGPSAGDKFEEAFGQISGMIDALPAYGMLGGSQKNLALAAQKLTTDAVKLKHGEQAGCSEAELEQKAAALEAEAPKAAKAEQDAVAMQARMQEMAAKVVACKIEPPVEIERKLWMGWMASLRDSEILDNQVIEDYLGPKGKKLIADWGTWHSDWEQEEAVRDAQRKWALESTGAVPVAPVPGATPRVPGPPPGPPPKR